MENFIVSIIWLGIGFISAMKLESKKIWGSIRKENPGPATASFVRLCWIILWPVTLIIYVFTGPKISK